MRELTDKIRQEGSDRLKALAPLPVRRNLVRARLQTRRATARFRSLPDCLIIGAQRSGTSSLYKYLGRHPNVVPSLRKEVEYFSTSYGNGEDWYRAHFPLLVRKSTARLLGRPSVSFEATPDYLLDPRAPERAAALLPQAKLIVLLRDPVDRAFSQYHHNVRLGQEELTFEEALNQEPERTAGGLDRIAADPFDRVVPFRRFSYVGRGMYADQLERWLAEYRRERLLILKAEELFSRPDHALAKALQFLELPAWQPPEFRNYSYVDTSDGRYPDLPDHLRRRLAAQFAASNRRVHELLGEDFGWTSADA